MKSLLKVAAVILVLGIGGYLAYHYALAWWRARNKPNYRQAEVSRGEVVSVVNATGTVQPVLRVPVGTFVSGPILSPPAESLSADTTGTDITANYDSTTGVLMLRGEDSVANYQRVLRSITYNNTSKAPASTPRVIKVVANDGTRDGNVATTTVAVVPRSDTSVAGLDAEDSPGQGEADLTLVSTEGGKPVPVGNGTAAAPYADAGSSQTGSEPATRYPAGPPSASGADGEAPVLDLDADDSSGRGGADFATTFTQDEGPVPVADSDAVLSDGDGTSLNWLTVTITNVLDKGKLAYYNQEVKKGEMLAAIDPTIYEAAVARDQAMLLTRLAEVDRVNALLRQAAAEERRAWDLKRMEQQYKAETGVEEVKFISDTELDQVRANWESLKAQLKVARAAVEQAKGGLENSVANLGYTKITSPVDGMIIDRKIDEGQTLAATFQTPELFVVAPNMREQMHVVALVDEADIGMIREAERRGQRVHFTVDAYPDDLFEGKIFQVRMNPTTVQNVVTYPVVVEAPNPELKLLPGMTANLSFEIDKHENVLRIPNAALRFYPKAEQVRPDDRAVLEGASEESPQEESEVEEQLSAIQRAIARKERHRRHVWVVEGDYLSAVEVITGLIDSKYTELVSGDLKEGQKLVTGVQPRKS